MGEIRFTIHFPNDLHWSQDNLSRVLEMTFCCNCIYGEDLFMKGICIIDILECHKRQLHPDYRDTCHVDQILL